MKILLRHARHEDLEVIRRILNIEIKETPHNYDYETKSETAMEQWFESKKKNGSPILVVEAEGIVQGYATYGRFRDKIGYQYCAEHSIYLSMESRGKGYGSILMTQLIQEARQRNIHTLIAGINSTNEKSIRFHENFGFQRKALLPEVGYKFGTWQNLVLMQLLL